MNIDVIVLTVNQASTLRLLFETAQSGRNRLRFRVFLHSDDEAVYSVCKAASRDIFLYPYRVNRGVARSWNEGIRDSWSDGAKVVLVVNDDVWFSPGDIDKLADASIENPDRCAIFAMGLNMRKRTRIAHNWSCFAINPIAWKLVGCFDENFWPVGGEDIDYMIRARACGLDTFTVQDTNVAHAVAETRLSPELRENLAKAQELNKLYFARKWGYVWNDPRVPFKFPFNDSSFDMRIAPEDRHAPYPGHDRPRHEVEPA
jgi:GT2 family glycosyltransferase